MIGPYVADPPKRPETWVQLIPTALMVLGGDAGIILVTKDGTYRNTADGRLWRRVR